MAKSKRTTRTQSRPKKELIPIDGEKLRVILWDQGHHSYADQAVALGTNEKRLRQALRGGSFQQATILRWCTRLEIDPKELVVESAVIGRNGQRDGKHPVVGDWLAAEQVSRWIEATNGLQYRIFKMEHRFLDDGRLARGKVYDMSGLSDADRSAMVEHLQRHPQVCQKIGPHPNVAVNLTALPDANARDWWVIDRWVEGPTLKQAIASGELATSKLPAVMRGIAEGLAALHRNGYLRRELSPKFVILEEGTGAPVLTDFELAKLLTAGPTVADKSDWRHAADPYRAPEVSAGSSDLGPEIDIYSWGRILLHAATGELPAADSTEENAAVTKLPRAIRELVAACVSIDRAKRPRSMDEVLRGIKKWS